MNIRKKKINMFVRKINAPEHEYIEHMLEFNHYQLLNNLIGTMFIRQVITSNP